MRIALVTETWLPSTDGVVTRLSATVRELVRAGHEVLVVAPNPAPGEEPGPAPGARVRGVPAVGFPGVYGGKRWGIPLPRVGRYLREFEPDVVHVANPVLLGIAAVVSARRQGVPLVASYHTDVARYAAYYRLGALRPVIWWLLRRLHGEAGVNLATSAATCAELRERGIDRVRLWRRGVDLDLFRPEQRGQAPTGPPTALYVGRLAAEKGLERLAPLAAPDSGVRLTLVGDGPARDELAEALPATYTGMLHGADLAAAYRGADVFVFPSTTDTLGLVVLEALASGLPVIAANTPASRELLGDTPAGRLFDAASPDVLPALVREVAAEGLGAQARREAERWGWADATESLLAAYRDVTSAGQHPAGHQDENGADERWRARSSASSALVDEPPTPDQPGRLVSSDPSRTSEVQHTVDRSTPRTTTQL